MARRNRRGSGRRRRQGRGPGGAFDPRGWHEASALEHIGGLRAHVVDVAATLSVPDAEGPTAPVPLVLLHGFACSSWAWRRNIPALSEGRRVLAPCHKGFGWSGHGSRGEDYRLEALADFQLRLLDRRGVERADLCGNSLGGSVALWIARHHPDRVRRLVLVNPAAVELRYPKLLFDAQRLPVSRLLGLVTSEPVVRVGLEAMAYRGMPLDEAFFDGFLGPLKEPGRLKTAMRVMRSIKDDVSQLAALVGDVAHDTLVIWGARDRILRVRDGHTLVQRMPRAELLRFEEAGHCPHEETPGRFNLALREFLDRPKRAATESTNLLARAEGFPKTRPR